MNTPFDLRSPSFVFPYAGKAADIFPSSAGCGKLLIPSLMSGRGLNFAELVVLQENYLIQFDNAGGIYALDIVSDTYWKSKFNPASVMEDDFDLWYWLDCCAVHLKTTLEEASQDEVLGVFSRSFARVVLGCTIRDFDSTMAKDNVKFFLDTLSKSPMQTPHVELRDKVWYRNGFLESWGDTYLVLMDDIRRVRNYNQRNKRR